MRRLPPFLPLLALVSPLLMLVPSVYTAGPPSDPLVVERWLWTLGKAWSYRQLWRDHPLLWLPSLNLVMGPLWFVLHRRASTSLRPWLRFSVATWSTAAILHSVGMHVFYFMGMAPWWGALCALAMHGVWLWAAFVDDDPPRRSS